uniref:Uncharacterized protein n=1 Tax=Arundo donax TaxID=35708 RepID=A0A0A8YCA2_ARUDO
MAMEEEWTCSATSTPSCLSTSCDSPATAGQSRSSCRRSSVSTPWLCDSGPPCTSLHSALMFSNLIYTAFMCCRFRINFIRSCCPLYRDETKSKVEYA